MRHVVLCDVAQSVCYASVPLTSRSRRHLEKSKLLGRSTATNITTTTTTIIIIIINMVNVNPKFAVISPRQRKKLEGPVAFSEGKDGTLIRYIYSYPKDIHICPWCGTTSATYASLSKHWGERCVPYRKEHPLVPRNVRVMPQKVVKVKVSSIMFTGSFDFTTSLLLFGPLTLHSFHFNLLFVGGCSGGGGGL